MKRNPPTDSEDGNEVQFDTETESNDPVFYKGFLILQM